MFKPKPFAEDQIRVRAYEIWQARGGVGGTPEDDWNAAIASLKAERFPIRRLGRWTFSGVRGLWNWTGVKEKKGWDFLQLLVVPLTLAIAGYGLQEFAKQRERLQQEADKQREQQISDDKAKQETLTKYLDQMSDLLQKGLRAKKRDSEIFIIAQAKTVTALQSLDPARQHLVIQFLAAANLNDLDGNKGLLYNARMSKANLANSDLSGAKLSKVDLNDADLSGADLISADLISANLNGADLNGANLNGANLNGANLLFVNLSGANLSGADLNGADLSGADLISANLNGADLSGTNLNGADLNGANLISADLSGTNLNGAILLAINLRTAKQTNKQQLEAALLCNVALPEGILLNPDRDCDRLPKILIERYPATFKTLEAAKAYVNNARKIKW